MSLPSRTKRNWNAPSIASRSSAGSPHAANKDCRKSDGVAASSASYSASVSAASSGPSARAAMSDGASRPLGHIIARGAQSLANNDGARRRIEADRIAGASAARRIIRQHASEALVRRRFAPEARPAASELGGEVDAVGERSMRDSGEFGLRVARAGRLEGDGARKNSPVDLRQRDMHREIRRPKSALRGAPGVEAHARPARPA